MELLNRKFFAALVLSTILAVSFIQSTVGYATETPANPEEVLVFLRDVVQLDMSKYSATLSTIFVRHHDWLGGLAQTNGIYTLECISAEGTSLIEVAFTFVDKKLTSCFLYVKQGLPRYSQPLATDLSGVVAGFLQKYQTYSRDSDLEKMQSVLNTVDVTKDATNTVDNIKLVVSFNSYATLFSWRYTFNDADYSRLNLEFRNGTFFMFSDDRSYYTIGGTEVNISMEEAVSIALKRVENYSYLYEGKEIANFNIVKEQIRAELNVLNRYKPLELYPFWMVDLPLDSVYPGSVYYIRVMLWADTGEIISIKELGYGGGFPSDGSTADPSTPEDPNLNKPQTEDGSALPAVVYIVAAAVAIAVPITTAAIIIKKKRSK